MFFLKHATESCQISVGKLFHNWALSMKNFSLNNQCPVVEELGYFQCSSNIKS